MCSVVHLKRFQMLKARVFMLAVYSEYALVDGLLIDLHDVLKEAVPAYSSRD